MDQLWLGGEVDASALLLEAEPIGLADAVYRVSEGREKKGSFTLQAFGPRTQEK